MARRKSNRYRNTLTALIISLLAHVILAGYLFHQARRPNYATKRGTIAVEFIEPVRHSLPEPTFRSGVRKKSAPEAKPMTLPVPGDPAAQTRATDAYIQTVLQEVGRRKSYPRESLEREEEGRVVVGVSIAANGVVLDVHVEEPSRFQRLDMAALKTVSDIPTFPPLPKEIEAPLHLHIPLVYKLEDQR